MRSSNPARARVAALALLVSACDDPAPPAALATPVMVEPVRAYSVTDRLQATGELVAENEATLAAEVGGQLTRALVDEGDSVAQGDVLLEIDTEKRELELNSQRASLAAAREDAREKDREAKRIRKLHGQNVASQTRLDEAETELRRARSRFAAAEAQVGLAERALRDAALRAPFAGYIGRRMVSAGDFVSPGQQLVDLVSLDPLRVEFHLPERDSGRVQIGHQVEVRVAPFPDEVFSATVSVISPRIDAKTRTLRVRALLPNAEGRLRPGLFARADLGVAQRNGILMVPEEAVLQRADGSVAYRLVEGDRVERRRLELGVFDAGRVEIVSGLELGDEIIVRGQDQLFPDSVVTVRHRDGAAVVPRVASDRHMDERPGG